MTSPFELIGLFGGFVFTDAGKRRMLLREGGHERLLKVPRILRRRIIGKFPVGEMIRVAVTEEQEPGTGVLKQVVSHVLPAAGSPAASLLPPPAAASTAPGVIRVCSKKNCWRQGGRELFEALRHELAASGDAARVEIRQVGCLDRCKQAPNADCGTRAHSLCSPRDAGAIVARAAGRSPGCEIERR